MAEKPLAERLEAVWQVLMVMGEDAMARTVAEAKHRILTHEAQARGEPQVFVVMAEDSVTTRDGAG